MFHYIKNIKRLDIKISNLYTFQHSISLRNADPKMVYRELMVTLPINNYQRSTLGLGRYFRNLSFILWTFHLGLLK